MGAKVPSEQIWKVKDTVVPHIKKHHQKVYYYILFIDSFKIVNEAAKVKEKLLDKMRAGGSKKEEDIMVPVTIPTLQNTIEDGSNLFVFQRMLTAPFTVRYCNLYSNMSVDRHCFCFLFSFRALKLTRNWQSYSVSSICIVWRDTDKKY
jgi:hypothetical protein